MYPVDIRVQNNRKINGKESEVNTRRNKTSREGV
jgi:hypothetical protein